MWSARFRLAELLKPSTINVDAVPGLTSDDATYRLNDIDLTKTDQLILSIGTNDALKGAPAESLATIDRIAERVASVPCVRWVALTDSSPNAAYNEAAHRVNEELLALAARHAPNLAVVRWDVEVANHPEWLSSDGIHHSQEGAEQFAELMALELRACPIQKPKRS
jgi:lysophospholipase L1-like esterase